MDPLRKGQPLYKGHSPYPFCIELIHFQLPKRGQPPYKEQNGWPQSALYSTVVSYKDQFSGVVGH